MRSRYSRSVVGVIGSNGQAPTASGRAGTPRCGSDTTRRRSIDARRRFMRAHRPVACFHAPGISDSTLMPRAHVLAALGVVRRRGERPCGQLLARSASQRVQRVRRRGRTGRVAADLVQRDQPVVDVERRVLDALRRHRAGHLLELADEPQVLAALFLRNVVRAASAAAADEVEHDGRVPRIAPLGRADRVLDVAAVVRR